MLSYVHIFFIILFSGQLIHGGVLKDDQRFRSYARSKRYLDLQKQYKINRRYQECVAPGNVPGHCKRVDYCEMDVVGITNGSLDYLCHITEMDIGVCCPDDILLSNLTGSRILMDLPVGALDYNDTEQDVSTSGCGITSDTKLGLGPDASHKPKEWPWLVAIYKQGAQLPFCEGALITEQHVLTAAHCTHEMKNVPLKVRLGEYDVGNFGETRVRDFGVKEIIEHNEYDPATYAHDIAIIKFDKPTSFDTYVWPICLPPLNGSYVNETVIVAGWGQENYAGPVSFVLMEVAVPVWVHEKCVDSFTQRITENNICAAAYEGGKDSCLGDSGGPLLYKLNNGRWTTIGIVSWGIGCGNKDQPGIYTRVDKYIPWIVSHTIGGGCTSINEFTYIVHVIYFIMYFMQKKFIWMNI